MLDAGGCGNGAKGSTCADAVVTKDAAMTVKTLRNSKDPTRFIKIR